MLFTPALAECFGCPFCHISLLIFEFVSACRESQNVFIIWFYYKQHRPMLKNEVKKTTTRPPRPSARQTGPKWTTHSVSVKLCIKEILEYKQTANKPPPSLHPPATQCALRACFPLYKQRRRCDSVTADASFEYRLFGIARRQKQTLFLQNVGIFTSCISKCVLWMLSMFVCESGGGGEKGRKVKRRHKRFRFHINIYGGLFEYIL